MSASASPPDVRTSASPLGATPAVLILPDVRTALADHPQYRLLDQLGEGGMGVVFRAEHRVMGRIVALKVMAPALTAKPTAVARFRQEVKAAARLNHPHIVTAHDAGEAAGLHFLVMEYVEGTSLDRVVAKKGPLGVPLACQFARQAAMGLQHAYERGMIHRDIKPQNLMVTRKGHVKVLDFGLARFARDADAGPLGGPAPSTAVATVANFVMGTPDYLSPEQAKCLPDVDIRADIYSLGCTLYFLLTGRPPFAAAETVFEKLLAHTADAPPAVAATRLDVPGDLIAVLGKMMAKAPADRYATPGEVAAALAPFARGEALGAVPTEPLPPVRTPAPPTPPTVANPLIPTPALVPAWHPPAELPPTEVISRPKPVARERRKRKREVGWTPARWGAVCAGVVVLLVGAAVIHQIVKRSGAPAVASNDTSPPPSKATSTGATKSLLAPKSDPPTVAAVNPWRAGRPPKVMFVLPQKGLWVEDYLPVRDRLSEKGMVVVAAVGGPPMMRGPLQSMPAPDSTGAGRPEPASERFYPETDLSDIHALVFVGKETWEFVQPGPGHYATATVIERGKKKQDFVFGAICTGQLVLAKHRILDGKAVARSEWASNFPFYHEAGATFEDVGVRTDGRVVTAAGPKHAEAFADALAAALRNPSP